MTSSIVTSRSAAEPIPKPTFPLHPAHCLYLSKRWQEAVGTGKTHSATHYIRSDGERRLLKREQECGENKNAAMDYFPRSSSLPKPRKPGPGRGSKGVRTRSLVPVPADGSVLFTACASGPSFTQANAAPMASLVASDPRRVQIFSPEAQCLGKEAMCVGCTEEQHSTR